MLIRRRGWTCFRRARPPASSSSRASSEPHRRYHTVAHLEFMLSIVDRYATEADDARLVRLACWFHDGVYDPARTDNEIKSAELAAATLRELGVADDDIAEVVRLVWLTTRHAVDDGDRTVHCSATPISRSLPRRRPGYAEYAAEVREEYRHVPDDPVSGRAAGAVRGSLFRSPSALSAAGAARRLGGARARQSARRVRPENASDRTPLLSPPRVRIASRSRQFLA